MSPQGVRAEAEKLEATRAVSGGITGSALEPLPDETPNPYARPVAPVPLELARELLHLVEQNGSSLSAACRELNAKHENDVPAPPILDPATVLRDWMHDTHFAQEYAIARRIGYEVMAEELLAISDDTAHDWRLIHHERTGEDELVPDHEYIARSRLKVDTRKWLLSKYLPKIYGDKLEVQHTTAFLLSPEWILLRGVLVTALQAFPEALAAVMAALSRPLEHRMPERPRLVAGPPEEPPAEGSSGA